MTLQSATLPRFRDSDYGEVSGGEVGTEGEAREGLGGENFGPQKQGRGLPLGRQTSPLVLNYGLREVDARSSPIRDTALLIAGQTHYDWTMEVDDRARRAS